MHLPESDIGAVRFTLPRNRNAAISRLMRQQALHDPPPPPKSLILLAEVDFYSWRAPVQTVVLAVKRAC